MSHKVSVIMGTYNGAKYLHEQLLSILNQTHENFELIIQDDGSTDDTMDIVHRYAADDERIRVYKNTRNLGINANFYDLIQKSTGDYIAISDQDDIWKLNKIETLLSAIGDSSLAYTDSELIDESGETLETTILTRMGMQAKAGTQLTDLYEANTVSGHSCLFTSNLKSFIFDSVTHGLGAHGMYDQLIATLASFLHGVTYYETPLTLHRIHNGNNHNGALHPRTEKKKRPADTKDTNVASSRLKQIWQRRIDRIHFKIDSTQKKRVRLKYMFTLLPGEHFNPFEQSRRKEKHYMHLFFDIQLYQSLIRAGIPQREARQMCAGKSLLCILHFF